jgi:hypothetical protein
MDTSNTSNTPEDGGLPNKSVKGNVFKGRRTKQLQTKKKTSKSYAEYKEAVAASTTARDGADIPLHSSTAVTSAAAHHTVAARKQSTQQLKAIIKRQESIVKEERAKTAAAIAGKDTQKRRAVCWKVTATAHKKQKMGTLADVGKISEERDALSRDVQEHPSQLSWQQ